MVDANFRVKNGLDIINGSIKIKERADAPADTAAYGQLWVKNSGDGLLYFTDDDGTDIQITTATAVNAGTVTSVTAGTGMTQTGTSTVNPTLNVIGGTGITANADNIAIDSTVATLAGVQILTNKSLTSPTLTGTVTATATINVSGNNKLGISDGGASAPTLRFVDDTDTGIYRPASGQIGFTSNGTAQIILKDGVLEPVTDNDVDIGSSSLEFKNAYFDGTVKTDVLTVDSTASVAANISLGGGSYTSPSYTFIDDNDCGMGREDTNAIFLGTGGSPRLKIYSDGAIDLVNSKLKIANSYGSDGQVLTSTGSGVAWENAGGGGATALNGLTDVISNITNFGDSILISPDGAAPPHGTLNNAQRNVGLGKDSLAALTSGDDNIGIGFDAGKSINSGYRNIAIGKYALDAMTTGYDNIGIGQHAGGTGSTNGGSIYVGTNAGKTNGSYGVIYIGQNAGMNADSTGNGYAIAIGTDAAKNGNSTMGLYIGFGAAEGHATNTTYHAANNTAIGHYSLKAIETGDDNSAYGFASLQRITTGSQNIGIGKNAGYYISTGLRNIAVGAGALDAATTESDNIAMGYNALGGAVAGAEKTIAIGNYAADAVTTADNLIAIGYNAAGSMTTGYNGGANSVYIGNEAGAAVTNGGENVVIGHQAGTNMSTYSSGTLRCSYNVLIGSGAGLSQTIGGRNTAVGNQAMYMEQETGYNAYFGSYAGYYSRGGEKNTGIGYGSMFGTTTFTGDRNTTIGYGGLDVITTGDDNIAIGCEAGDNITTGSNNVVIGNADVPSATGSDQLSISSGDGGVTWLTGNASGGIASKAQVVAVAGNTTLTEAQSGSYVYWTSGTCTLPTSATVGTQFTVFNNTGSSATVGLGTNNSVVSNWATNAAVADNEATSYICVSATNWVQVG